MGKIVSIESLEKRVQLFQTTGKKVVLCHGVFDLLHPGHTLHFEEAKSQGDILVVSVTCDKFVNKGPGRPLFSQDVRMRELAAREVVNYVVLSEYPTGVEVIRKIKPDIYAKGKDYLEEDLTRGINKEKEAIEEIGGTYYVTDTPLQSSSTLINEYFSEQSDGTRQFLNGLKQSHTSNSIIGKLQSLKDLRVLTIGDTIMDEYVYCDVLGASPKDNMITANYIDEERFPGGVLAVANHIAGFCDKVQLVTQIGKIFPRTSLGLRDNITAQLFHSESPTITKRRFIEPDSFRKLFSIERIPRVEISRKLEDGILDYLMENIEEYDLVLVSDFGHGLLTEGIISRLCSEAKFLAVNTQTNSANKGFNTLNKYARYDYTSLDELELRLTCQEMFQDLKKLILKVQSNSSLFRPLGDLGSVTMGKHGSLVFTKDELYEIPNFSSKVLDTVGAGDAYLAVTSLCAARNFEPELIGFIGNAVGALQVRWVGNKESVNPVELYKFITTLLK